MNREFLSVTFSDLVAVPALLLGFYVMMHFKISVEVASQNIAAWIAMLVFRIPFLHWFHARHRIGLAIAVALEISFLAATMLGPHLDGIHRWIKAGVLFECAPLLLPILIVALAFLDAQMQLIVAILVQTILLLQPDRSEATAFACAMSFAPFSHHSRSLIAASRLTLWTLAAITWLRFDPLPPVPHVEGIVELAFLIGPFCGCMAVFSLILLLFPFLKRSFSPHDLVQQAIARSLFFYFAVKLGMIYYNKYPVPLLGYGVSSVAGYAVATGLLTGLARRAVFPGEARAAGAFEKRL